MVYYELMKVTIDTPALAEVMIEILVRHHSRPDFIVSDQGLGFNSKFWLSLCYFFGINQRLSTAFYLQIDGQTEKQNSILEAYLWAFINIKQDNWVRFLLIAKFSYNNAKNASTGHTLFKLNCDYPPQTSYKKDVDL